LCASVCARAITPAPLGDGIVNHATPSGRSCSAGAMLVSALVQGRPGWSRPMGARCAPTWTRQDGLVGGRAKRWEI
jgi:hypothetical protein